MRIVQGVKKTPRSSGCILGLSAALMLGAGTAFAHGVAVDTSGGWTNVSGVCDVAIAGCSAQTVPFEMNVPGGLTNQIYIYDNGLISLGQPLSFPVSGTLSSLADLAGQNVVTPGYQNGLPALGPAYITAGYPSEDLVYLSVDFFGNYFYSEIDISPASGGVGAFTLTYKEGDGTLPPPIFGYPTFIGYQIGDANADFLAGLPDDVTVAFPGLAGGVPEPASWALMVLGLGLAGAALRRARGQAAARAV
jgi:hypothetical protein